MSGFHIQHDHDHSPRRATAAEATWSLLRLSALQRVAGAGVILVVLWAFLGKTLGWY